MNWLFPLLHDLIWFPEITEEGSGEGSGKEPEEDGSGREGSGIEGSGGEEIALYEGVLEYEVQDYLDGW